MVSLTDSQLAAIMNAARLVPVEKRDTFLQRIAAMLALRVHADCVAMDAQTVEQAPPMW